MRNESHTEDKPKGKHKTEEGGRSTEQMLPLSVFGACGSNMKMHYKFGSLQNASKCKLLILSCNLKRKNKTN